MSISATSTTNSESSGTLSAFATLRFVGDKLDPDTLSRILSAEPTLAYRKGEAYCPGARSPRAVGRTGMWYLSTRRLVASRDPIEHLRYLLALLPPDRLDQLRSLMRRDAIEASVSCFWHGRRGLSAPAIPPEIAGAFRSLPANIETDFATD